ncbi:MAG TPA: 50S ribosomal protein L25 [Phycisphaerales bacterium]|nr:50S ribosomal protein L25 [Phycisphaerales bacterium]
MHEKSPLLTAKKRERLGSRYCERIRKQGGLPAIVYGHGEQPIPVYVEARETVRHITAGEKVFRMELENGFKDQIVLLKELQFDYLGTNIVHADFARVDLNERVKTRVPIHLIGEAKGLKTAGAILMHPTAELEIECRVVDLPDFIECNVADLDVGHAITAADVKLPREDMKLITDKHAMVAQIVVQAEVVTAEASTVAGAAEPEVLTAKKAEEGAAGAAKDAKGGAAAKPAAGGKDAKPAAGAAKPAGGGDKKK